MDGLTWVVKASLRAYILQSGGEIRTSGGAILVDDVIHFPSVHGQSDSFRGTVHFVAHGGMLDWSFSDPQLDEESAHLSVTDARGERFVIAEIVGDSTPTLTSQGSAFFEGMYPAGARLDPLVRRPA